MQTIINERVVAHAGLSNNVPQTVQCTDRRNRGFASDNRKTDKRTSAGRGNVHRSAGADANGSGAKRAGRGRIEKGREHGGHEGLSRSRCFCGANTPDFHDFSLYRR